MPLIYAVGNRCQYAAFPCIPVYTYQKTIASLNASSYFLYCISVIVYQIRSIPCTGKETGWFTHGILWNCSPLMCLRDENKRNPPRIGDMELVSLSCNRVFISYIFISAVGQGWCEIAIATKWYQFHATCPCNRHTCCSSAFVRVYHKSIVRNKIPLFVICENNGFLLSNTQDLLDSNIYLKLITDYKQNNSVHRFTPLNVYIHPGVIWTSIIRPFQRDTRTFTSDYLWGEPPVTVGLPSWLSKCEIGGQSCDALNLPWI